MSSNKTIRISEAVFDDRERAKTHAALIVLKGAEIGRDFRLRKPSTVVGRGDAADVRLPDDSASRAHARVDRHGTGTDVAFVLTDLGSTNGTFVNAQPIETVDLRDGDQIRIGDTVLKFVLLDSIEASFHAEIRDRITYDRLTGLLTKESLFMAFERELGRCIQYDRPLSVLMMDLDRFKSVNDTHGHLMGSHVLAQVGRVIRDAVRVDDVSARYGGEEFVTYLAEVDADGALVAAERIRRAVEAHEFVLDDVVVHVTISIGVATAPGNGTTIKALVGAADEALYEAKGTGRNRVCSA